MEVKIKRNSEIMKNYCEDQTTSIFKSAHEVQVIHATEIHHQKVLVIYGLKEWMERRTSSSNQNVGTWVLGIICG